MCRARHRGTAQITLPQAACVLVQHVQPIAQQGTRVNGIRVMCVSRFDDDRFTAEDPQDYLLRM